MTWIGLKVILLSSSVDPKCGWGRFTREFCEALIRKGVSFELHLPYDTQLTDDISFRNVIWLDLPSWHPAIGRAIWRLGSLWRSAQRISQQLPCVPRPFRAENGVGIVVHALVEYYSLVARWVSLRTGWPFGVTGYGTYIVAPFYLPFDRFWFRRVVQEAAFVVTVSRYTADQLRHASGLDNLPVQVIHPGINLHRFRVNSSYSEARQMLGLPEDVSILLFVGALKERKGVDLLLRAFARVYQHNPQTLLLVVGAGDRKRYQTLAQELGISTKVRFLGAIDDQTLQQCYAACDLFVLLPRRTGAAFEGFGMVYLEANAFGKPVVGAKSGGAGEAVLHNCTGILVPEGDWEGAGDAILELLINKEKAKHFGLAGRLWAEEHSWDRVVDVYLNMYRRALVLQRSKLDGR